MGRIGNLEWMNSYSKKHCTRLFWRMRAVLKKAVEFKNEGKHQFKFQYDPSSYALNFDDGGCFELGEKARVFYQPASSKVLLNCSKNTTWICVIRVGF